MITNGLVNVHLPNRKNIRKLGTNDIIGMENVFNNNEENICNVHVENKMYAQKVSI